MEALAEEAVKRARTEFGKQLDFRPDSVEAVEEILEKLHKRFAGNQVSLEQVGKEAMTWGAYIGEVIRHLEGGRWERDHPVGGLQSHPIH